MNHFIFIGLRHAVFCKDNVWIIGNWYAISIWRCFEHFTQTNVCIVESILEWYEEICGEASLASTREVVVVSAVSRKTSIQHLIYLEMFTFQRRQEVYGIHICMKDIHHLYIYILYMNLLSSSICADTPQIDDNSSKAYHIFSQLVLIGETITSLDEAIVQEHEARQESLPMMLRE